MKLLPILLLLALPAAVQAQFTYTNNYGIWHYTTNNGTITITSFYYTGSPFYYALTIPSEINNLPVTSIGDSAFLCSSLTNVTIPNSVTNIGNRAFANCLPLTSAIIGTNVTSIGDYAFSVCSLTSVTIPNSVTSIGTYAFNYCSSLTNVTIGTNVNSIGDWTFYHCTSLRSATIPNSVTSIGTYAFYLCTGLTNGTIPNSVTNIKTYAFSYCSSLTNVTIGTNVTSIGTYAFFGCSNLTSVTIPNSVTSLGNEAFYNCTSLTNVMIGNSVTSIGSGTFAGCRSVTSVTIGNSVTNIGNYAFADCHSLAAITVNAGNPAYIIVAGVLFNKSQTTLIACPDGKAGEYTIPKSVTSIVDGAFYYCTNLTGVYFQGNAPSLLGSYIFTYDINLIIYYLPGTTGWDSTFGGVSTALWFLPNPLILNNSSSFGVQTNEFGFIISWATNIPVVVEACTDLANPVWSPVGTNTLTGGWCYFSDPAWTNFPGRFYRLRSP